MAKNIEIAQMGKSSNIVGLLTTYGEEVWCWTQDLNISHKTWLEVAKK